MAVANASSTASTGDDVGVSTTAMETHTIKSLSDIIAQSRIITVPIVSKLPIGSVPIPNSGPPALSSTFEARGRAAYGEDHHTYNASSNRKRPVSDAGAVVTQLRSPPSAMTIVRPHVTNSPPLRKLMKADVEFTNMAVVTEFSRITRPERQPVSEQSMSMRTGGDGSSTFNRLTLSQRHLSAAGSRSNRCINEKSKGLRHFSTKVCDKVRDKGRTTYNEVADELVSEYFKGLANTPMTQEQQLYDQKNIRRRVYDALNVLMAMNIISKERKEIKWIGLPSSVSQEVRKVEEEKKRRLQSIQQKMDQLQDLVVQQVAFKRLVERNRAKEAEKGKPSPEALLYLPFIIVTTDKKTVIDCNISNDRTEYLFTFDRPFEIHDDVEVLKRINNLSQTTVDLESIRQFLPSSVMRFADCAITECTALATFNGDTILLSRKIFRQTSAARTCDVDSLRAIADNDVDGHFDSPARRKRHQPTAAISRSSPAQADREIRLRSAEQPDSERDWVLPNAAGDVLPSVSNAEAANLMTHKNKVPSQDMAEKQQSTPTTTAATFAPVALLTVATGLGKQLNVQKKIWS